MSEQFTTDHNEIRTWFEARGGAPVLITNYEEVARGSEAEGDYLHISFDPSDKNMTEITWAEFFDRFETDNLALVYDSQEEDLGAFEFVDRERAQATFSPETELPDSGDEEVLRENIYPDAG